MKGYIKRRVNELGSNVKPKLFHKTGYLNDLNDMISAEYIAQLDVDYKGNTGMVKMLVDLELIEKEK